MSKCWKTGKIPFDNRRIAERKGKELNALNASKGSHLRVKEVYLCEHCNKWHMTSMPHREFVKYTENMAKKAIKPTIPEAIADRLEYLMSKPGQKK